MRNTVLAVPLIIAALVSTATVASAQQKSSGDVRAIVDQANQLFMTAMNTGKYGDAVVLYTDDAMVLPPGAPLVKGRAAIQQFWNDMSAWSIKDVKLTTAQLDVFGDVAIETGGYSMKVTPPGASAPMEDVGKFIVVWKRQKDGSWKIYRDMFNADSAPPM